MIRTSPYFDRYKAGDKNPLALAKCNYLLPLVSFQAAREKEAKSVEELFSQLLKGRQKEGHFYNTDVLFCSPCSENPAESEPSQDAPVPGPASRGRCDLPKGHIDIDTYFGAI